MVLFRAFAEQAALRHLHERAKQESGRNDNDQTR